MVENCFICKKKLKLAQATIGKCKCKYVFCQQHIHNHNCTFNFKMTHQSQLEEKLPVVEHTKIEVI